MKGQFHLLIAVVCGAAFTAASHADQAAPPAKAEVSVNEIMVSAHVRDIDGKGNRGTKRNLDTRVLNGQATEREKSRLLELYRQLAETTAPKGSPGEWRRRTAALVEAMEGITTGREGAKEQLAKALDCTSCHDKFKSRFWPGVSNMTDLKSYDQLLQSAAWLKDSLPPRRLVELSGRVKIAGGRPNMEGLKGGKGWVLLVDFSDMCTDESLYTLAEAKALAEIRILKGGMTDIGLGHLHGLPDLKTLTIDSKEITEKGLISVGALTALDQLDINQARVTEKGLTALAKLTNLKELYLSNADVRDKDVEPLKGMKQLEWLSLPPSVSKAKCEELKLALPKTSIIREAAKREAGRTPCQ